MRYCIDFLSLRSQYAFRALGSTDLEISTAGEFLSSSLVAPNYRRLLCAFVPNYLHRGLTRIIVVFFCAFDLNYLLRLFGEFSPSPLISPEFPLVFGTNDRRSILLLCPELSCSVF